MVRPDTEVEEDASTMRIVLQAHCFDKTLIDFTGLYVLLFSRLCLQERHEEQRDGWRAIFAASVDPTSRYHQPNPTIPRNSNLHSSIMSVSLKIIQEWCVTPSFWRPPPQPSHPFLATYFQYLSPHPKRSTSRERSKDRSYGSTF